MNTTCQRIPKLSVAALRAEGVFDVGRVGSIVFVTTEERVVLFHVHSVYQAFYDRAAPR